MTETPREDPDAVEKAATPPPSDRHEAAGPQATHGAARLARTRAASAWTGLVIGIIVAILLLIFILQNLETVTFQLFAWHFTLPAGISLLLAAIAGALIMALAGGIRIIQIRRVAQRAGAVAENMPPE
ncbi:LapA family protein [Prescottella agglutinans]|uniref:Integral membrane protein n=1 Tax=Prescottella agglutinans TaxID=1644129 RepID=A0ABT6MBX0_9NOCA|nr:lipopolysaccharide assembly protein LapA domain-containing protein [Prescottella agglutinans]MDH6281740.1 putative integral membrane protein [Prescottella agglutinans]